MTYPSNISSTEKLKNKIPISAVLHVYSEVLDIVKDHFGLMPFSLSVYVTVADAIVKEDVWIDITEALSQNSLSRSKAQSNIASYAEFNPADIVEACYAIITSEGIKPYFKGDRRVLLEHIATKIWRKRWGFGGVKSIPTVMLLQGLTAPTVHTDYRMMLRLRN